MIEIRMGVRYEIEDDCDSAEADIVEPVVLDEVRKMIAKLSVRIEEMGITAKVREYHESDSS